MKTHPIGHIGIGSMARLRLDRFLERDDVRPLIASSRTEERRAAYAELTGGQTTGSGQDVIDHPGVHAGFSETSWGEGNYWPHSVRDYFTSDSILFCPKAPKVKSSGYGNGPQHRGATFLAWNARGGFDGNPNHWAGSYGKNGWVANSASGGVWWGADPHDNLWNNTVEIQRPDNVPLVLDSAWFHPLPLHIDSPPPVSDDMVLPAFAQNIRLSVMDRHLGAVNVSFFDGSARQMGLKGLWTLKWHPLWNLENRWTQAGGVSPTDWPVWMRNMRDY